MMCAIYEGTKTLELVRQQEQFVLQLLTIEQLKLVKILGKQSGHSRNKILYLKNHGLLELYHGYYYLKNCAALMHIEVFECIRTGDHHSFLGHVIHHKNISNAEILTTEHLRQHRIIR